MTDTVDTNELEPSGDAAATAASEAAPSPSFPSPSPDLELPQRDDPSVAAEADEGPDDGTDEGDDDETGAESGDAAGASSEGPKKKRRRRRRKKKPAATEGEAAAAEGAAETAPPADGVRRKEPHHPFQRLFEGAALKRHAFSVGEVVAGRVTTVRDDVAVVDLFGKATAFARACEPRDIPAAQETTEPAEAEVEETASGALEAPAAEAPATTEGLAAQAPEDGVPVDASSAGELSDSATSEVGSAPEGGPASASGEAADVVAADEEGDDEDAPGPAAGEGRAPLPPPAYLLAPEGVPPIEAPGIFRGRVGAVAESGHVALVNENIDVKTTRAYLRRAKDDRTRVPGLVFGYNRGGFDVLVFGLRAFCPVSGMTMDMVDDPEPLLGQWAQFHVQAAKSGAQGLVVSRRSILEKEARKRAKLFLKSLEPGSTVRGRVTQVRDFGLFVDIGGVEGLLHQSELSWERGVKPEDVAKVGDELDVQVLNVHERESKRERHDRISLSIKALQPDPWKVAVDSIVEGQPRKGKVVRTAEFGAFVQLAPGVDGLLHISELGRELKHADQVLSVGDDIYVVVERIDRKARRLSLSRLSNEEGEAFERGELTGSAEAPRVRQGGSVRVKVTHVGPAGLEVQVDNAIGKRGRGFIPNSEMGTPKGTDHRRQWPPGTELDVLVIGTDRDGALRCSRKRQLMEEERRAVREYRKEVSRQGLGTFADLLRQKLGGGE